MLRHIGLTVTNSEDIEIDEVKYDVRIRYQMEEKGESHHDNMMPDGSINDNLTI